MTLAEIKEAVNAGYTVHWGNDAYVVVHDNIDQWFIKCLLNDSCIGLTHTDDITMNGEESEFYVEKGIDYESDHMRPL